MSKSLKNARIAIVVGTLGQGGAERQLLYMLRAMLGMSMIPAVLSFTAGEHYETAISELGIPVHHVGGDGSRLKRLRQIYRAAKQHKADLVMSLHFYTNAYGALVAKLLGVPSIGGIRGDYLDDIAPLGVLGKLSFHLPDIVAANSLQAIENAVTTGKDRSKLFFLPNVVDTDVFAPAKSGTSSSAMRLVLIGRIEIQKRVDRFLRLVQRLSEAGIPVEARIYGKGTLQKDMELEAEQLGLFPDIVQFMGPVSSTQHVYHECDVFVLTSDYEGTPNVILEAMASGVPIVSTAAGGVPALLRHREDGMVVPLNNEDTLFEAVSELYRNPEFAATLGRNARNKAVEMYSVAKLGNHLQSLFSKVYR